MKPISILATMLLVAGCSRPDLGGSPGDLPAGGSPGGTLTTSTRGVTLKVTPSTTTVDAGGQVTFTLVLRNDRAEPLTFAIGQCGDVGSLTLSVPLPLEPAGRAWSGAEGWFKDFALTQGLAGGGVPATDPLTQTVQASPCGQSESFEASLAPGASVSSSFTWKAEIIPGLEALAGPVDFAASAGFDRQNGPPSYAPDYTGVRGSWFPIYRQVKVEGRLQVSAGDQHPISIGQAIDGLLGDSRFASWLEAQPPDTCQGANLLPMSGQGGSIFKEGPNWEIDLFCEAGVPRHWAIAGIDPLTAGVRSLTFCDVPCDR